MAFDPEAYEQAVIRPLRRQRGRLDDGDLVRRYAIEPGLDRTALEAHLRRVRAYWNQNSTGAGSRAQVCRLLIAADEELQRRHGASLLLPEWWQSQAQKQNEERRGVLQKLAADLARAYGGVGKITKDQLAQIVDLFPGLDQSQVDEAVRTARLEIVETVELPASSGLDRVAYLNLRDRLDEVGAATVVQLLHPELARPFTLVRAFGVAGDPAVVLTPAVLEQRIRSAEAMADGANVRARKAALGVLRTGVAAGADLRTIALFQIMDRVRDGRSRNLADVLLVGTATGMGLEQGDAELLVLSLPVTAEAPDNPATHIRTLLEEGLLRAAQQALSGLSPQDDDAAVVRALVDEAGATTERLLREASEAESTGREDEARRLLLQARNLARDDEDIEDRLRRLPMSPPRDPTAVEAGATVQLGWKAPASTADGVRYRVVRTEGRPPASERDGAVVAQTADVSCADGHPPVARHLHYAVYASADDKVWSRPAICRVVVLPPVTDVVLRADPDRITATWQLPAGAVGVRVRRSEHRPAKSADDGAAVAATPRSFVDESVRRGVEFFYSVTALYHDDRGREVQSSAVIASAVPRAEATAVSGLTAETLAVSRDLARIRLSWADVPDTTVRVRYAGRGPTWAEGTVVPVAQLDRYGSEVVGQARQHGSQMVLEADVPIGYHVFVPFALGGSGAVVGRSVGLGIVDSVRELTARRTGPQAMLTWVWPGDVNLVEVTWTEPTGSERVWRITRGQYTDGAGCVVTVGPGGGTATLRAVAIGPSGEAFSPPSVIEVKGQDLRLSYRVSRPSRLRPNQPWQIRILADNDCTGVDLSVVVAGGMVLPMRADQGTVVERFTDLTLAAGVPFDLQLAPPRGIRRPYWVRCFVTRPQSVLLTDPPIDEMKVA